MRLQGVLALVGLLGAGGCYHYLPSSPQEVAPGQAVRLRLEAWPAARYGHLDGRVVEVERVPMTPGDLAALPLPVVSPGGEPRYRITVALDPIPADWAGRDLLPGLRLQADVMLERRRLIDWMLAPLQAAWDRW